MSIWIHLRICENGTQTKSLRNASPARKCCILYCEERCTELYQKVHYILSLPHFKIAFKVFAIRMCKKIKESSTSELDAVFKGLSSKTNAANSKLLCDQYYVVSWVRLWKKYLNGSPHVLIMASIYKLYT